MAVIYCWKKAYSFSRQNHQAVILYFSLMIYLDSNGTTDLSPFVRARLIDAEKGRLGDAASVGVVGAAAREEIAGSRESVARLIGADEEQIAFVSSGSEANVSVIRSVMRRSHRPVAVVSEIEHSSTISLLPQLEEDGYEIRTVPVLSDGVIDLEALRSVVDERVGVVSVQAVNNETGVIQPVSEISAACQEVGTVYHCDAAQAVGKMAFDVRSIAADYVTFTGHKFHAPAGIGVIYSREGWSSFPPLITGGSQEFGIRGGTHNILGIIGIGAAAEKRRTELSSVISRMGELRDRFETTVLAGVDGCVVNGASDRRVTNTSNLQFAKLDGKALYAQLLDREIICAQTSACTSQYPEPSRVLRAMGLSYHDAFSSIRFSVSELNTTAEIDEAAAEVIAVAGRISALLGGVW